MKQVKNTDDILDLNRIHRGPRNDRVYYDSICRRIYRDHVRTLLKISQIPDVSLLS